jgi:glycosyltransferase involved in cell wall biosynthesis
MCDGVLRLTLVTVGICVKNNESTIREAIDSVVAQDFPHELMEVIVVDGSSRDKTVSIIKERLKETGIKTRFYIENKGIGFARQLVVDNAKGKYILWLDGDLILSKTYIKEQERVMKENAKVGITAGGIKLAAKNLVLYLDLIPSVLDHMRYEQPRGVIWKTKKFPPTAGAMFRVEALRQVNGFDVKLGAGEDWDVVHRMDAVGWEVLTNDATFCERHGEVSTLPDLCKRYLWYGYTSYSLYKKNKKLIPIHRMSPIAGFITGFFYCIIAYRLLHRKIVFLLPFHFTMKMSAFSLGFVKGQINLNKSN